MGNGDCVEVSVTFVWQGVTVSHTHVCPYEDFYDAGSAVKDAVASVFDLPLPVLADALMAQAEADRGCPDGEEAGLLDALYDAAKAYLDLKGRQDREDEAQAQAITGEAGHPPGQG